MAMTGDEGEDTNLKSPLEITSDLTGVEVNDNSPELNVEVNVSALGSSAGEDSRVVRSSNSIINSFARPLRRIYWENWVNYTRAGLAGLSENLAAKQVFLNGLYSISPQVVNNSPAPNLEREIFQQTGNPLLAIAELIDNGVDATLKAHGIFLPLGRFGRGSAQALRLLRQSLHKKKGGVYDGDYVFYETAQQDLEQRRLIYYKDEKTNRVTLDVEKRAMALHPGTLLQIKSSFFNGNTQALIDFIGRTYSKTDQVAIYVNGKCINPLSHYERWSGDVSRNGLRASYLIEGARLDIRISTDAQGHTIFELEDSGTGMSDENFLTKLPRPGIGDNTPEKLDEMTQNDPRATHSEILVNSAPSKEMKLSFVVGPRVIESHLVKSNRADLDDELIIKLPLITSLTTSKDGIIVDEIVRSSFEQLVRNYLTVQGHQDNLILNLNSLISIARELDRKNGSQYHLERDLIEQVKGSHRLLNYMQMSNILLLPDIDGVQQIATEGRSVVYLDKDFFDSMPELWGHSFKELDNYRGGLAYIVPKEEKDGSPFIAQVGTVLLVDEQTAASIAGMNPTTIDVFLNPILRERGLGRVGTVITGADHDLEEELNLLEPYTTMDDHSNILQNLSRRGANARQIRNFMKIELMPRPVIPKHDTQEQISDGKDSGNNRKNFDIALSKKAGLLIAVDMLQYFRLEKDEMIQSIFSKYREYRQADGDANDTNLREIIDTIISSLVKAGDYETVLRNLKNWGLEIKDSNIDYDELLAMAIQHGVKGITAQYLDDQLLVRGRLSPNSSISFLSIEQAIKRRIPGVNKEWVQHWVERIPFKNSESANNSGLNTRTLILSSFIEMFPQEVERDDLLAWVHGLGSLDAPLVTAYARHRPFSKGFFWHVFDKQDDQVGFLMNFFGASSHVIEKITRKDIQLLLEKLGLKNKNISRALIIGAFILVALISCFIIFIAHTLPVVLGTAVVASVAIDKVIRLSGKLQGSSSYIDENTFISLFSVQTEKGKYLYSFKEVLDLAKRYVKSFSYGSQREMMFSKFPDYQKEMMTAFVFSKFDAESICKYIKENASNNQYLLKQILLLYSKGKTGAYVMARIYATAIAYKVEGLQPQQIINWKEDNIKQWSQIEKNVRKGNYDKREFVSLRENALTLMQVAEVLSGPQDKLETLMSDTSWRDEFKQRILRSSDRVLMMTMFFDRLDLSFAPDSLIKFYCELWNTYFDPIGLRNSLELMSQNHVQVDDALEFVQSITSNANCSSYYKALAIKYFLEAYPVYSFGAKGQGEITKLLDSLQDSSSEPAISETEQLITEKYKPDYQVRQLRFLENLSSSQMIDISNLQILSRISLRILENLTPDIIVSMEDRLSKMSENDREILLLFFELISHHLESMTQHDLNVVVRNWIQQSATPDAEHLINNIIRIHEGRVSEFNEDELPKAVRDFWRNLKEDEGAIGYRQENRVKEIISSEAPLRSTNQIKMQMSLAEFIARIFKTKFDLKGRRISMDNILHSKAISQMEIGNTAQSLNSVVIGQQADTFIREMVQNARDAYRALGHVLGNQKPNIAIEAYIVHDNGKYRFVTNISDEGIGMDDKTILNDLLPMGETSKERHMGQGFYTILAGLKMGDSVEIMTGRGDGHSYAVKGERGQGRDMSIEMNEYSNSDNHHGTQIQRMMGFDSLAEARRAYHQLEKDLQFYCGTIDDMEITFNNHNIALSLELGAVVGMGAVGLSTLELGGLNQVTSDELSMPARIDTMQQVERYWQYIPVEIRDFLFSYGVVTDIPSGILLDTGRTQYAQEEFKDLILTSESLKVMLTIVRLIAEGKIKDRHILDKINAALHHADQDGQEIIGLDQNAAWLNLTDSYGQRRYDKVSPIDMGHHWYQLLVRLELSVGSSRLSLLDVYRQSQGLSGPLTDEVNVDPQDKEFELPQNVSSRIGVRENRISVVDILRKTPFLSVDVKNFLRKAILIPAATSVVFLAFQLVAHFNLPTYTVGGYSSQLSQEQNQLLAASESPLDPNTIKIDGLLQGEFVVTQWNSYPGERITNPSWLVRPQGEKTGEVIHFRFLQSGVKKGQAVLLPEIYRGVPENVRITNQNGEDKTSLFDITHLKDGYIISKEASNDNLTVSGGIPRRDENNQVFLPYDRDYQAFIRNEKKDIPVAWSSTLKKVDSFRIPDQVHQIMMKNFEYNNGVSINLSPQQTFMGVVNDKVSRGEKVETFCVGLSRVESTLLNANGVQASSAGGILNTEMGLVPHEQALYYDGQKRVFEQEQYVPVKQEVKEKSNRFVEGIEKIAKRIRDYFWILVGLIILGPIVGVIVLYLKNFVKNFLDQRSVAKGHEDVLISKVPEAAVLDQDNLVSNINAMGASTEAIHHVNVSEEVSVPTDLVKNGRGEVFYPLIEDLIGGSYSYHPLSRQLNQLLDQEHINVPQVLLLSMNIAGDLRKLNNHPFWLLKNVLRFYRQLGVEGQQFLKQHPHDLPAVVNYLKERSIPIAEKMEQKDKALIATSVVKSEDKGGIDLTPESMHLQIKTGSVDNRRGIQFHLDPAMLEQLKDATGFVPIIINIQPIVNLKKFLGLPDKVV